MSPNAKTVLLVGAFLAVSLAIPIPSGSDPSLTDVSQLLNSTTPPQTATPPSGSKNNGLKENEMDTTSPSPSASPLPNSHVRSPTTPFTRSAAFLTLTSTTPATFAPTLSALLPPASPTATACRRGKEIIEAAIRKISKAVTWSGRSFLEAEPSRVLLLRKVFDIILEPEMTAEQKRQKMMEQAPELYPTKERADADIARIITIRTEIRQEFTDNAKANEFFWQSVQLMLDSTFIWASPDKMMARAMEFVRQYSEYFCIKIEEKTSSETTPTNPSTACLRDEDKKNETIQLWGKYLAVLGSSWMLSEPALASHLRKELEILNSGMTDEEKLQKVRQHVPDIYKTAEEADAAFAKYIRRRAVNRQLFTDTAKADEYFAKHKLLVYDKTFVAASRDEKVARAKEFVGHYADYLCVISEETSLNVK